MSDVLGSADANVFALLNCAILGLALDDDDLVLGQLQTGQNGEA